MKYPTCNSDLLDDVVNTTKESPAVVKDMVGFFMEQVAKTIAEGAFDTVLVPYFGKFEVKRKELQFKMHRKGITKQQIWTKKYQPGNKPSTGETEPTLNVSNQETS